MASGLCPNGVNTTSAAKETVLKLTSAAQIKNSRNTQLFMPIPYFSPVAGIPERSSYGVQYQDRG
jgi:hypothetical protein